MIHATYRNDKLEILQNEPGTSRKRRWRIEVTYDTPAGSQAITVKPGAKCRLAQVTGQITEAIREDAKLTGSVTNIAWEAWGK